jgi:glycosyltransferase involved in cell wall biosynthesis
MTIYNAEPHLEEAIDSIIAQTFDDWELIAIENGSSDSSPAILAGYEDERIRVFALPENIGRTPALRYAFDRAQGEYIAVLDADDVSYPKRLERQVEYLAQHLEVALVGSWAEQINASSEVIGHFQPPVDEDDLYDALGWSNPIVHSSIMYRAGYARQVGGYPAAYTYAQDFALILAIARNKDTRLRIIGEYLCKYRFTGSNMTRNPGLLLSIGQEQLALLREAAEIFPLSEWAAKRNRRRQAVAQVKIGVALVKGSKVVDGLKRIAGAIIRAPEIVIDNGIVNRLFSADRSSRWL